MSARRTGRGILLIAAATFWAGAAAVSQQPGAGGMQQQPQPQQQPMPGQPGSPGAEGMPTNGSANQQSYADQSFVHDTMQNNDAQVAMSQLAAQKSSSADVKQFGAQMVKVHTQLNDQLSPAVKQLNMSAPKGPSKKEKKQIDKLQSLSGADFDAAYLQEMAKEQQHDLKQFKSEAGAQGGLQQLAKVDLPVLTQNYQILEKVAQAHNVTLESKK
jgi:putative membrane protein